jgi:hypothetical protein
MDTTKLSVGDKVWAKSGDIFKEGMVIEMTEKFVEVELFLDRWRVFIRFDKNGKQPPVGDTDPDFDVFAIAMESDWVPRPLGGDKSVYGEYPVFPNGDPWDS